MNSWHTETFDGAAVEQSKDLFAVARIPVSIGAIDAVSGQHMRHEFAPHMHEFFGVGLIDRGSARVRYRGAQATATTGSLITISAGEIHTGAPAGGEGWAYRMFYPQRGLLRLALGDALDEDETLLFPSPFVLDNDVRGLFDAAFTSLTPPGCALAAEERLLALLRVLVLRHCSRPPRAARAEGGARVAAIARAYLEAHFAERVKLSALAEVCQVSPFHLIRTFRRECGLTPHAYLKQIRVGRALAMLQRGIPASQVAHSCGFADQSHLTRNFKGTFGLSPGAYQRAAGMRGPADTLIDRMRQGSATRTSPPRTRGGVPRLDRSC